MRTEPQSLPKRGYTIDEVVALGVFGRRSTVYKMIDAGTLKARKLGRRTIILADDIEAAIAALPAIKSKVA